MSTPAATPAEAGLPDSCRVPTLCLRGARAIDVDMELRYTGGLMQRIIMTGLPGSSVRESRDRIRGCLDHYRLPAPRRSVLVNFAPADLHKDGNGFDLPLAVGILTLTGLVPPEALVGRVIVGELALDGRLRPVRGGLILALHARRAGFEAIVLPRENGPEAGLVTGLRVEAVATLEEALSVLAGDPPPPIPEPEAASHHPLDLADVRGQLSARRALEIAAAGRHNLLMIGPPGTGKTMLAQRLPGILPPLSDGDALQVAALHGLMSGGPTRLRRHAPFRAPHHTVSRAGLIGGGRPLLPGEVCLAHAGVLFLDEMPEFGRAALESLRQPIEDHCVRLCRAGLTEVFPARFQLVGAMNPCPCGYMGHATRGCTCTGRLIERYRRRLSGPLLDRLDMCVELQPPDSGDWLRCPQGEASEAVAGRVARARTALDSRPPDARSPHGLAGIGAIADRLEHAIDSFTLSGRSVARLVSVCRTIAALDGRQEPGVDDLDEAMSFRLGLLEAP